MMAISFLVGSANAATIGNWKESAHSWNFHSYSAIAAILEDADHTVEPDAAITVANLASYDLFVMGEPRFLPDPDELTALSDWVQAGGVLLIMTDQGSPGTMPANNILEALGSSMSLSAVAPTKAPLAGGVFASEGPPFDLVGQTMLVSSGNSVSGGNILLGDYIHWEQMGAGFIFTFGDRLDHNGFQPTNLTVHGRLFLNIAGATVLYVDADATGLGDGSSWCDAFTELYDALAVAGARTTIRVAAGTYRADTTGLDDPRDATFQLISEVIVEGGFAGCGEPDPDLQDIVAFETVLSGDLDVADSDSSDDDDDSDSDDDNAYHVVTGSGTDETAQLSGFTVAQGNADGDSDDEGYAFTDRGAGLFNRGGSPTVRYCTFLNNRAKRGAGVMNQDGSSPRLLNCAFISNQAHDQGGGVGNRDAGTDPTLTNCLFTGNSAKKGGAVHSDHGAAPTLINCTVGNNTAKKKGSGIAHAGDGVATVTNCILWGNGHHSKHGSRKKSGRGHSEDDDGDEPANRASDQIDGPTDKLVVHYSCIEGLIPDGPLDDGTNIGDDPLFVDADGADNRRGTDDDDLRLTVGSPCIDAGDSSANTLETDLDGNPRIVGDAIDMGAYEQ